MKIEQAIHPWSNWIGDYTSTGHTIFTPGSKDDLIEIVNIAVNNNQRLRAVGAAHSSTSVARPDDILVNMDEMQGVLPLNYLKDSMEYKRDNLVRLHSGTRLKYANRVLLNDIDKAVANMGSFDWQTLIGAISTGTHGSSIYTGPMAESVCSIEMVTVMDVDGEPQVKMRRIEPGNGITDRVAFEREESKHNTELIQDDDTFYSCVVSFGSIGLVYSLTFDVLDKYWLTEKNEALEWNEVKKLLQQESLPGFEYKLPKILKDIYFWEFLVNCAETQGKKTTKNPMCFVRSREKTSAKVKPSDWKNRHEWPPRRDKANCINSIVEDLVRPKIDNASGKILGIKDIGNTIRNNFEKTAKKIPFEGDVDYSRNYWVLRREPDDTKPQEEPEPPPDAISNEIAVPLENTVAAVDMILDIMSRNKYFYPVPFGVRFVAPSRHFLAMQYDRPTCMIEVPMVLPNRTNKQAKEMSEFKKALEEIEKSLCYQKGHLGGRPHWGQYNSLNRNHLEKLYDKLPTFEMIYSRHNAFGTFDNDYTRQIGLKYIATLPSELEEVELEDEMPLYIAAEHVL